MKAPTKPTPPTVDPLAEATRALSEASAREARARADLDAAKAALETSEAAYETSGTDADLDKASKSTMVAKRAKGLHEKASEALAAVQAQHGALLREHAITEHHREILELPAALTAALAPSIVIVAELDVRLDATLIELTRVVTQFEARWDAAEARARALGVHWGVRRPNLLDAIRQVAIKVTKTREKEGREQAQDLLGPELGHGDYRISPDMSHQDVVNQLAHSAHANAEAARGALLVTGANYAASQQGANP